MKFFVIVLTTLVTAVAAKNATFYTAQDPIKDFYIVVIEPQFQVSSIENFILEHPSTSIKYTFKNAIKGLSAKLTENVVEKLLAREEVKYIAQDGVVEPTAVASWGLDRVNQRNLPLDGQTCFRGYGGVGVNVYVIDTGIYPESKYFEGRAKAAFDAFPEEGLAGVDVNGHGTHGAGTIGSNPYGVAKKANLFGVRVFNKYTYASYATVIAGCDYVAGNAVRPAVASIGVSGGGNVPFDDAVQGIIDKGIAVVASAANRGGDACSYSPGRGKDVITVGATAKDDSKTYYSSYGSCVDVFAPGESITSAFIGGPEETRTFSGTSMACAHVTGYLAVLLDKNPNLTPAQLKEALIKESTKDVVRDPGAGSPNRLVYVP